MSRRRYTEEFKVAAVRQITVEGHSVRGVAKRLGISTHSLYVWKRRYGESPSEKILAGKWKGYTPPPMPKKQ